MMTRIPRNVDFVQKKKAAKSNLGVDFSQFIHVTFHFISRTISHFGWIPTAAKYWKLTDILNWGYQAGLQQLRAGISGLHGNIWDTPWPGENEVRN